MDVIKDKANKHTANELNVTKSVDNVTFESRVQRIRKLFEITTKQIILVLEMCRLSVTSHKQLLLPAHLEHLLKGATIACNQLQANQYPAQNKNVIHRHSVVVLLIALDSIMKRRLATNAIADIEKKDSLYSLWIKDDNNRTKIKAIQNKFAKTQHRLIETETNVKNETQIFKTELQRIEADNANAIDRLMINSNEIMVELCEIGKCRYYAELDSMRNAQEMLDTLMRNNQFEEKQAAQEKTKLQKQLRQLIKSYDDNIGERSANLYESQQLLKQESQTLLDWSGKFDSIEIVFCEIQAKKEAIEKSQREARFLLYMMNHAARTIQRFYRALLAERKQKKKKGKKGGKSKAK